MTYDRKPLRASITACCLMAAVDGSPGGSAFAGPYGSFRLKAGETADFQTGPRYLNLRVCNDVASSGSIVVTIGDRQSRSIGPGECTDNPGDHIRIQNRAAGEVAGIYKSFFNERGHR
jgi:hypothetical protein